MVLVVLLIISCGAQRRPWSHTLSKQFLHHTVDENEGMNSSTGELPLLPLFNLIRKQPLQRTFWASKPINNTRYTLITAFIMNNIYASLDDHRTIIIDQWSWSQINDHDEIWRLMIICIVTSYITMATDQHTGKVSRIYSKQSHERCGSLVTYSV